MFCSRVLCVHVDQLVQSQICPCFIPVSVRCAILWSLFALPQLSAFGFVLRNVVDAFKFALRDGVQFVGTMSLRTRSVGSNTGMNDVTEFQWLMESPCLCGCSQGCVNVWRTMARIKQVEQFEFKPVFRIGGVFSFVAFQPHITSRCEHCGFPMFMRHVYVVVRPGCDRVFNRCRCWHERCHRCCMAGGDVMGGFIFMVVVGVATKTRTMLTMNDVMVFAVAGVRRRAIGLLRQFRYAGACRNIAKCERIGGRWGRAWCVLPNNCEEQCGLYCVCNGCEYVGCVCCRELVGDYCPNWHRGIVALRQLQVHRHPQEFETQC